MPAAPVCCTLDGQHRPGPGLLKKDAAAQGQMPLRKESKCPSHLVSRQSMVDIALTEVGMGCK